MNMHLWALSGFLGLPADWDFLQIDNLIPFDWQALPWKSLNEWGSNFNQYVQEQNFIGSPILMGYSLGGRLALHALIQRPHQWRAAIIISAHPGLSDPTERLKREQKDQHWAKKFENEDWRQLMKDWNGQEVFTYHPSPFSRQERDYQRSQLVNALCCGSLGKQSCLRAQIASLPFPILWITGGDDLRFCEAAQSLVFSHPLSRWQRIDGGGHRIPWSQPKIFRKEVLSFISQVE